MARVFLEKNWVKPALLFLAMTVPTYVFADTDVYSSQLANQSNQAGSPGFKLVRTRIWPNSMCVIDGGPQIVNPGQTTVLKIKKSKECSASGVGYSIYKVGDNKNEHLIGYLSHRFAEEKFSIQISRFCKGDQCVFKDLNPQQD